VGEDVKTPSAAEPSPPKAQENAALDYLFHLDALPERIAFRRRREISGWLFHRHRQPIQGLFGMVRPSLRGTCTHKARRKHPGRRLALPRRTSFAVAGLGLMSRTL
jgi:hypothetical protein